MQLLVSGFFSTLRHLLALTLFINGACGFLQREHATKIGHGLHYNSLGSTTSHLAAQALRNCVCLVTGASRGIGKAIAVELGNEGAIVYITGTSSSRQSVPKGPSSPYVTNAVVGGPGTIEDTAALVNDSGGIGIAVYCDHGNDNDVRKLFDKISLEHDRLDILVNNAFRIPSGGVQELKGGKFWETGIKSWDAMHSIGLRSHFVSSIYAVPLMLKAKSRPQGRLPRPFIAMISSFGGIRYVSCSHSLFH